MTPEHYQTLLHLLWERAAKTGMDDLIPKEVDGLTSTQIATLLPTTGHAILLLLSDIQERAGSFKKLPNQPMTDYLFELIMAHLDAAQPHRPAIRRLWGDLWFYPSCLPVVLPGFDRVIEDWQNHLKTDSVTDYSLALKFRWFIVRLFHTWLMDDTLDQSKTMVLLNEGLLEFQ